MDVILTANPQDVSHVMNDPYLFIKDVASDHTFEDLLGEGIFGTSIATASFSQLPRREARHASIPSNC